ncbi:hypothetical protein CHS0354_020115 [Potamilus streckersoni]|uniref:N-acetyltransferase domain-containing protein n=1 Tax=Potamilus streckersoni TaxID=2493646 RepID=A0AAE0VP46_9BIVA|nr:hypothetical protein CHS0354_020115 [Potamilus streckersoni]
MRRSDIQSLYELTSESGRNIEKSCLECVFDTDPSRLLVVVKDDGKVIGHNGALAHGQRIASAGLNILRVDYRGLGIGRESTLRLNDLLADMNVGGNAVYDNMAFYRQFGFNIKSYTFQINHGPINPDFAKAVPSEGYEIIPLLDVKFDDLLDYDSELHSVSRHRFIRNWTGHTSARTYVALKNGRICGYAVLRPAYVGYKMYPIYADEPNIAKALFCRLVSYIPKGQDVIFTQPVQNEAANEFVAANKFQTQLTMTRIYNKWNIPLDIRRVYSVASTEFGLI